MSIPNLQETLSKQIIKALSQIYDVDLETVEFQATRKDFEGDITVVVFPILRVVRGNPAVIGEAIGAYLVDNVPQVSKFNVVKGFLNLVLSDSYYLKFFNSVSNFSDFGKRKPSGEAIMVEYSSPNTNKPLHLGHVRNVLLGYSVSEILKASGRTVYKTQIVNDRGIHICKSMLAWKLFGNNETPESSGLKGDKLVGKYYVRFDKEYKKEMALLVSEGKTEEEAKANAPILLAAKDMLLKWEAGDADTVSLWKEMNGWVYLGFDETYKNIGVDFDKLYYESSTYLLGKEFVEEGLSSGVFFRKDDDSVWCDLTDEGLDEK
ncbi:MAG: arginyl-tRNA synthetase, partial [Ulvibacter sp.]